ncbi:MAG: Arm DNA-binding domain-containing protein [Anaerolineae bacterium]|nr:Arm DNA-binding domain-containing protein [Anaerolineae bacterium]
MSLISANYTGGRRRRKCQRGFLTAEDAEDAEKL